MKAEVQREVHERYQVYKRQTRYTYNEGPMLFLGQQIVKRMEDAGYPSKIFICYRSPEQQEREFSEGDSKAHAFQSAHQYYEAVDIVHATLFWNASQEYWDTLAAVVKIVEEQFKVDLVHGYDWGWDSAHIEMADWKMVKRAIGKRVPTPVELRERFAFKLPEQWRSYKRRRVA